MRLLFCFFRQRTAYELRISDWSSDVCSSDLMRVQIGREILRRIAELGHDPLVDVGDQPATHLVEDALLHNRPDRIPIDREFPQMRHRHHRGKGRMRSEEHTSELQSLMRISYAVFCLKTKTIHTRHGNI